MSNPLYFDQLEVGDHWRSQGRTITETDLVNFAGITGDYNPLHVDHEFARQTPFGRPIAHGLLGLSLVAGLGSHSPSARTVAFVGIDQWQFLKPVYVGDTVYAVTEVVEKQSNGRSSGQVLWKRQLVNQDGCVVQTGFFRTLVARQKTNSRKPATHRVDQPGSQVVRPRPSGHGTTSSTAESKSIE
jgi:acyl dehydratase